MKGQDQKMHLNYKKIIYFLFILIFLSCNHSTSSQSNVVVNSKAEQLKFPTYNLMPVPAELKQGTGFFRLDKDFSLSVNDNASEKVFKAADRFLRRLDGRTGLFFNQGFISKTNPQKISDNAPFAIIAKQEGKVQLNEDESYKLIITENKINLEAATDIGAIRGFETLLQLLSSDDKGYYFPALEINDYPRFPWRGLMIDVARHFMPLDVLKRNIDAMAAVKMNVFHFHICDDQGWRVESKVFPKLQEVASNGLFYTQEEVKELVKYAADRGIRVMPEIDVPGHATAILTAFPELGSAPGPYELQTDAGIFNPVLNPIQDKTYDFLEKLFAEMTTLFPDEYFHIGGDENNGRHWKDNVEIQAFMKKQNIKSVHELQTYFNNRLIKIIQKLNKKMVGWEEIFQPGLDKNAVIHVWLGKQTLYKAATEGYRSILSNGYYIDLMQPAWEHYENDPLPEYSLRTEKEKGYKLTPEQEKLILGGEATMWSELVTPATIDSRVWPRTAAIAERLWSPSWVRDIGDMYRRLDYVSFRLEELGLTHIKNRDVILRNLSNGADITPLKILAGVIEPYKIYTRNNGLNYKTYSPYTMMVDAVSSDARDARIFTALVDEYVLNHSDSLKKKIENYLILWKNNNAEFLKLSEKSPVLRPMNSMSEKLAKAASIGQDALNKTNASEQWYNSKTFEIEAMKKDTEEKKKSGTMEEGRTELMVLSPIQKLIDLTNPEAAKKRITAEQKDTKK